MEIQDNATRPFKYYKELTSGIDNDYKNQFQGNQIDDQDDDGTYTETLPGVEDGWQHWIAAEGHRHDIGSWAQAVPCIRDSEGNLKPILNRSLVADTDYQEKVEDTGATSDATAYSIAEETENGETGILVACLNHEKHAYIFFPTSDGKIKVDHETGDNLSTKIYDIMADGSIDPANIGTTKELLRVDSNLAYLRCEAGFHDDGEKKGPLAFETSAYPALTTPDTPANYAVKCAWDGEEWKWYAIAEASESATYYARIRWHFTLEEDQSEGELLNYDPEGDSFSATGTKVWITWKRSSQVQFWTAGNDTVFVVKLVKEDVVRREITRNLYRCVQCVKDDGIRITHLETTVHSSEWLVGNLLSDSLVKKPWADVEAAKIKTTIGTAVLINSVLANIPGEWDTQEKDYKYLETSDFSRGVPFWFSPIRPVLDNRDGWIFRSAELTAQGNPIAYYQRAVS